MKVFLINPPFYFPCGLEYLSQNPGLAYIAAYLAGEGHDVLALDTLAEGKNIAQKVTEKGRIFYRCGLPYEAIVNRIPGDTDLIGVTAPFSNHAVIIDELAGAIKRRYPDIPIAAGGVYPSAQPERVLEGPVDFAVVGEGEKAMAALAAGNDPETIPGVWFKKNGRIHPGGCSELISDLDSIPFPARRLFPMEEYLSISPRGTPGIKAASIITSRGCPFACTFCSIHPVYQRKWRARSPDNILAEIDELTKSYDVKFIEFEDDNLTLNRDRAAAIFEGLARRGLKWACSNGLRVDSLDRELLKLMKRSGGTAAHLAIESGDPAILETMNKKLDLDKVEKVAHICKELELPVVAFFIVGHPGETEKSFKRTLKFARKLKKLGMINCGVHIATPYPGTRLLEICKQNGYLIHEDAEQRVMFPGDIHIETPHFSRKDVLSRINRLRIAAGVQKDFTSGLKGLYSWKIRPTLSKIGLGNTEYLAEMPEQKLEGFGPPQTFGERINYRNSAGRASLKTRVPERATGLEFFAKAHPGCRTKIYLNGELVGARTFGGPWEVKTIIFSRHFKAGQGVLEFKNGLGHLWDSESITIENAGEIALSWLKLKTSPGTLSGMIKTRKNHLASVDDLKLTGFYPPERVPGKRVSYRWTRGKTSISVFMPEKATVLEFMAGSVRKHDVEVFLNDESLGKIHLAPRWQKYALPLPKGHPGGNAVLSFVSDTFIPSVEGMAADGRELGFMLRWYLIK